MKKLFDSTLDGNWSITTSPASIPTKAAISVDVYAVVSRAVEEGVRRGFNRAHKHVDKPDPEDLMEQIRTSVMADLAEVIKFDDPVDGE